MMKFNPNIHHRRSIRLKGYDYSQNGFYFLTICCHNRRTLFGEVIQGKMILNDAGRIAESCWQEIPKHFPFVVLHAFVIMPNHVHGIVEIKHEVGSVGSVGSVESVGSVGAIGAKNVSPQPPQPPPSPPRSPSGTIGSIVRGFKIGVTKWMRSHTDVHDVWQRNYYENIVRDERAYQNISNYIHQNPAKWDADKFFGR